MDGWRANDEVRSKQVIRIKRTVVGRLQHWIMDMSPVHGCQSVEHTSRQLDYMTNLFFPSTNMNGVPMCLYAFACVFDASRMGRPILASFTCAISHLFLRCVCVCVHLQECKCRAQWTSKTNISHRMASNLIHQLTFDHQALSLSFASIASRQARSHHSNYSWMMTLVYVNDYLSNGIGPGYSKRTSKTIWLNQWTRRCHNLRRSVFDR